jgi:hypothetical protein
MSAADGSSPSGPPPRETLRGGRYEVRGVLGEGAQAKTLDGIERLPGGGERRVAIKRFDVRGAKSWKDYELAEREATVLQSLSHPSLPRYVDHFEENGSLYLVMERIEGESLAAVRQRGGALPEADVARFLRDASDVLDYLHRRPVPVIHRDIKPGNVIRRTDGSFAIVDFGAVRDKLRPEGGSTVVGTFGYMAPEQFQGRALPASDVYSVGATALAMLTGQEPETLPHRGLGIDVRAALRGNRSPLARALERMVDPDPDERPARLAPLLAETGIGAKGPRNDARGPSDAFQSVANRAAQRSAAAHAQFQRLASEYAQHAHELSRREQRRAMRLAQRQARRMIRLQNRLDHGHHLHHRGALPWPVALFLTVLFSVGIVAVTMATRVVVPLVLLFLSRFFHGGARNGLVNASVRVRAAGHRAVQAVGRAQGRFWQNADEAAPSDAEWGADPAQAQVRVSQGRTRVEGPSGGPTRVVTDDDPEAVEDPDDLDADPSRRARTGR